MGRFLSPVAVLPVDDAFQGHRKALDFELWHFEAQCDNGYSFTMGVMIYRLKKSGIIKTRLRLHKEGSADIIVQDTSFLSDVTLSDEFLSMQIGEKFTLLFDQNQYKNTGKWLIQMIVREHDFIIDLRFHGTTDGWKTNTEYTNWAVIFPRAVIQGSMILHGQKVLLQGKGYHDHNWAQSPTMFLTRQGWFCGSVSAAALTIVWATETRGDGQIVVMNQDERTADDEHSFYPIPPKDFILTMKITPEKERRWRPTEIRLKLNKTMVKDVMPVSLDLVMKIVDLQHIRFFTQQYYVCLVKTTGVLQLGEREEHLQNSFQSIEFPDSIVTTSLATNIQPSSNR